MSRSGLGFVAVGVLAMVGTAGSVAEACHPKRGGGQGYFGGAVRHPGLPGPLAKARSGRQGRTEGGGAFPVQPVQPSVAIAGPSVQPIRSTGPITPAVGPTGPTKSPAAEQAAVVPAATAPAATASVATTSVATQEPALAPADEASPSDKLPEVTVGSTVMLAAKDLGTTGRALLVIDKLTLDMQVDEWTADRATATLPNLAIRSPVPAAIVLVKADGQAASTLRVQLLPTPDEQNDTLATVASLRQ